MWKDVNAQSHVTIFADKMEPKFGIESMVEEFSNCGIDNRISK